MGTHEMPPIPIPDLSIFKEQTIFGGVPIVAIGGYSDSGKDKVAQMLQATLKFPQFDTSLYIGEQLTKMGFPEPHDRWMKGRRSDEYHLVRGNHIWALFALNHIGKTLSKAPENSIPGGSITGSRFHEEWTFLEQFENVAFVWLYAPQNVRLAREIARGRADVLADPSEYIRKDEAEQKQMRGMRKMAEVNGIVIDTNRPLPKVNQDVLDFAIKRFTLRRALPLTL